MNEGRGGDGSEERFRREYNVEMRLQVVEEKR